jgi:hypothetical protein
MSRRSSAKTIRLSYKSIVARTATSAGMPDTSQDSKGGDRRQSLSREMLGVSYSMSKYWINKQRDEFATECDDGLHA